jgi:DMSO reductase anchor subunit/ferredoxin
VAAYEKDAATGIVRHLDDQCIGCQYCIFKCPYDVPKYSHGRGIVRKCDMCYARLAANEAPACVQACPNGAITIEILSAPEIQAETQPGTELVPGAFDSSYTRPTTRYRTRKAIPSNAAPGDRAQLRLDPPHWPLIWMLVLAQLAAGLFVCLAVSCGLPAQRFASIAPAVALSGFVTLHAGLVASIFHLGHPGKAWRFFLGLRSSWMSREILVFALFAAASGAAALSSLFYLAPTQAFVDEIASATPLLTIIAAILGVTGIFCSAMIYVDTRRPAWNALITFPKFFGTTVLLGAGGFAAICHWIAVFNDSAMAPFARGASIFATLFNVAYAAWDALVLLPAFRDSEQRLHRVAQIVWKLLRPHIAIRTGLLGSAMIAGAIAIVCTDSLTRAAGATVCALSIFISAIIERYCYFTAADAPRMPGRIAS